MQKVSVRYGDMLSCGWLPPVFVTAPAFMATFPFWLLYGLASFAHQALPPGPGTLGVAVLPLGVWV